MYYLIDPNNPVVEFVDEEFPNRPPAPAGVVVGLPNRPPFCVVEVILLLLLLPNKPPFWVLEAILLLPLNKPVEPVEFAVALLFPNKLPALLEVVLFVAPNKPPDGCAGLFPNNELLAGC